MFSSFIDIILFENLLFMFSVLKLILLKSFNNELLLFDSILLFVWLEL